MLEILWILFVWLLQSFSIGTVPALISALLFRKASHLFGKQITILSFTILLPINFYIAREFGYPYATSALSAALATIISLIAMSSFTHYFKAHISRIAEFLCYFVLLGLSIFWFLELFGMIGFGHRVTVLSEVFGLYIPIAIGVFFGRRLVGKPT